jgi:hypothetical protein
MGSDRWQAKRGRERQEERVTIACSGCGRTQTFRRSKLTVCDSYWCSWGYCKLHPEMREPSPPDGYVCEHVPYAAAAFSGLRLRPMTDVDRMAVKRAQRILARGQAMLRAEALEAEKTQRDGDLNAEGAEKDAEDAEI